MQPLSHIIIETPTQIECSSLLPPIYKFENEWYAFVPEARIFLKPRILEPTTENKLIFKELRGIGRGGIYSEEEISKLETNFFFNVKQYTISNIISRNISGLQTENSGFSTCTLFSKEDLKQLAQSSFKELFVYFKDFGIFMSGILGIFFIIKIIWYILTVFLRTYTLYKVHGLNFLLLAGLTNISTLTFLNRNNVTSE